MTPILEALQAAEAVGFDAPKCGKCSGRGRVAESDVGHAVWAYWFPEGSAGEAPCWACSATGLGASDPERLIGRALWWLHAHKEHVLIPHDTGEVETVDVRPEQRLSYSSHNRECVEDLSEHHDGTLTGFATALLRLVARVGTPQDKTP